MAGDVFCNECGNRNPGEANFCSTCGSPLKGARPGPQPSPSGPRPRPSGPASRPSGPGQAPGPPPSGPGPYRQGAAPAAPDVTTTSLPYFSQGESEYDTTLDLGGEPSGVGTLVVKRGPNVGSRFALDADVVEAGRHPDSQIFLDDITVSRRHVEIRREAEGYVVYDVGSLNGTYLNRQRVDRAPLRDGDELQIGTFKLVYVSGGGGVE